MKTTILTAAIALFSLTSLFGQYDNLSVGINGGIPVGDVDDFATFNLEADVAYRFNVSDGFKLGGLVAYSHFFGDSGEEGDFSWEVEDFQFMPLAASARFTTNSFFIGGDVGYAVGINDGNEGGFYYRPHLGYYMGNIGILGAYSGISRDNFTVSTVNLGIEFKF